MNVLITGAAGFLGRNLVAWLHSQPNCSLLCYERKDEWQVLAAQLAQADIIYHLAGVNRPPSAQEFVTCNVELTQRICDHLLALGRAAPIVFASSTQAAQANPYGQSKQEAESVLRHYAHASGARTSLYRLPNVFGKWSRPNYNSVVATFCHNIARGFPITIADPDKLLTLVYVDDVMRQFLGEIDARGETGVLYPEVAPQVQITLRDLAAQIEAFRAGRHTLLMPNFADTFVRKLYATYLTYLPEEGFAYGLERKCDARGCLAEFVKQPGFGQIFVSRTAPGVTRGNHFHHTKTEKFLVLEGEACVRFRHLNSNAVTEYCVTGAEMRVIDIPPGYTHSLENTGQTELVTIFWAGEIFDPAQPDTYALPVIL